MGRIISNSCQYDDGEYDASDDLEDFDDSEIDESDTCIENVGALADGASISQEKSGDKGSEALICTKLRNVKNFSDECDELIDDGFTLSRQDNEEEEKSWGRSEGCEEDKEQSKNDERFSAEDEIEISKVEDVSLEDTRCKPEMDETVTTSDLHRRMSARKEH